MRKIAIVVLLLIAHSFSFSANEGTAVKDNVKWEGTNTIQQLYEEMQLDGVVNFTAFRHAVSGYFKITERKRDVLTLIDFSKASTEERMYVFDMKNRKMLYHTVVAHGRNSGDNYAKRFSNRSGSYMSSLGFYLTGGTYNGGNGYSLILNGLEKGFNDKARERAVVVHGAAYANPSVICPGGRLGRSLGCPALPQKLTRPIIDAIKDGSVMYIYADDKEYMAGSTFYNQDEPRA